MRCSGPLGQAGHGRARRGFRPREGPTQASRPPPLGLTSVCPRGFTSAGGQSPSSRMLFPGSPLSGLGQDPSQGDLSQLLAWHELGVWGMQGEQPPGRAPPVGRGAHA